MTGAGWVLQDTPKKVTYDLDLTKNIDANNIFIAETGLTGTISSMLGNKLCHNKNISLGNLTQDGRYRVYNASSSEFPEADGILEVVTNFNLRTLTFYTPKKKYMRYGTTNGTSNSYGAWREVGNTSYDINNYSTTQETIELINSLIGVPKTSLIEQTNRIIEMLKGEK